MSEIKFKVIKDGNEKKYIDQKNAESFPYGNKRMLK